MTPARIEPWLWDVGKVLTSDCRSTVGGQTRFCFSAAIRAIDVCGYGSGEAAVNRVSRSSPKNESVRAPDVERNAGRRQGSDENTPGLKLRTRVSSRPMSPQSTASG